MSALRVLLSILALPFMVTVVLPAMILINAQEVDTRWPFSIPIYVTSRGVGLLLIGAGLWLLVKTLRLFAVVGKGTLAPWDPTKGDVKKLVETCISDSWSCSRFTP